MNGGPPIFRPPGDRERYIAPMRRATAIWTLLALGGCGGDAMPPPTTTTEGRLTVAWKILDASGGALSCAAAQVQTIEIAIGGSPMETDCAPTGAITFDGLVPGPYPVVIVLRGAAAIERATHLGNAEVEAGSEARYEHSFRLGNAAESGGALRLAWRIDGQPAASQCETVGAETLRVRSQPGSIADVSTDAACGTGTLTLSGLRSGLYTFRYTLHADDDTQVLTPIEQSLRVEAGATTDAPTIGFSTFGTDFGHIRATWLIDGRPATDACAEVGGETVDLRVLVPSTGGKPAVVTLTATAACEQGARLLAPPPTSAYQQVTAVLRSTVGEIATDTATGVRVQPGRTSTVALDLVP